MTHRFCCNKLYNTLLIITEGAVTPINMEDWAAQQKALKDAERQKKSDSEAALHNYKGITEQSALTKLKEEDRAKQLLAQKQLHDYRSGFTGTGKARKTRDGWIADATSGDAEDDDVTGGVSVSDTVANMNYTPTEEDTSPAAGHGWTADASGGGADDDNVTAGLSVSDKVANIITPTEEAPAAGQADGILVEKPDDLSLTEPMVMVADKSPDGSEESPKDGSSQEWVAVPPAPEQPTEEEWGQMTMKHDNFGDAPRQSLPNVVNVDFTFALLTQFETPDVDKYMKAAAFVVGDAVSGESVVKSMQQHPFDRPGVRKFVVTATMPSTVMSGHTGDESRKHVLGLLKTSVQDGTFYSIA